MNFQLTEEQTMLKRMVHDFAEKEVRPQAAEWEEKAEHLPQDCLQKLIDLGLIGMTLPQSYGGQGQEALDAILAIEELARVTILAAHPVFESSVGPVRVIEQFGTEELKQKYLPPASRGEMFFAVGMTEPEAGTALTDLTTRAVLDGDHYIVNGQKRFVTGGGVAEGYVVYVRLSEDRGARGIGGLVIEKGIPGFTFGKQEQPMGFRGTPSCDLIFQDCRVPRENLVVKEGEFSDF